MKLAISGDVAICENALAIKMRMHRSINCLFTN